MTESADNELLDQFARKGSEMAFAMLVERHIALVYSVALRHTANPEHAQDITQAVFIILARKAGALGRRTVVPGWLYHTARLTAANFQKAEARRIRREHEVFMQSTQEATAPETVWRELATQLDEAMARLSATDRDAVVLRYFQNKSLAEVGAVLGLAERAAQKRVSRALEKLRKFFAERGVSSTTAIIAGELSANSVHAAPVALAKSVAAVAVAKGSTATVSTLTLVKGTLRLMTWIKVKLAIGVGAIALGIGTTLVVAQMVILQPRHLQVPSSKEPPQLVVISSGKEVIAELRIMKPGTLDLQAGGITWVTRGGKNNYSCTGGTKLELLAEGRSVLKVSGDRMLLVDADQNLQVK